MSAPFPRTVSAQGLALRLWDHGEGSGRLPRVLCVHGYLDTGRSFDAFAAALSGRAHVLALDLRGHGQSERVGAGGSYHLLDHLKDLMCVVDALAIEGAPIDLLVGHSMGGNIALLFAGAVPARCPRLLLVDACGGTPDDADTVPDVLESVLASVTTSKKQFQPAPSLDEAIGRLQAMNAGVSTLGARRMLEPVLVRGADGLLHFPFDARLRGPTPMRFTEEAWRALAGRCTMPVTLLRATDGYVMEGETLDGRLGRMANARLVTVEGPHHLHVEAPDALAREALALLAM